MKQTVIRRNLFDSYLLADFPYYLRIVHSAQQQIKQILIWFFDFCYDMCTEIIDLMMMTNENNCALFSVTVILSYDRVYVTGFLCTTVDK